ncbi:hypothetical protein TRAPUB_5263 [Trametes pubescens]|uniref:Uncharacterized protein n=1 Tax=Trametes pubescens TaxID=154538 RepID=A0A1M2V927_TRAPU|nr:hypothetical protein TRAPUB_5263 [Trametes pubescens]
MSTEQLTTPLGARAVSRCVQAASSRVVVRIRASVRVRPYPARRTNFTSLVSDTRRLVSPRDIDGNAADSCPFATRSAGRRVWGVRDFREFRNWRLWEAATRFVTEAGAMSFAEDSRRS